MTQRLNYAEQSPQHLKRYMEFARGLAQSSIDETLRALIEIRASQINGCTYCVDMHVKQARLHGERELRLYHVAVWHESNLFSARERAALTWTESLTRLTDEGVTDAVYEQVRAEFSEQEISDLTFCIMAINGWNRVSRAFGTVPGSTDAAFGLDKAGLN
ncbi:carboxymuconolactone decarboxylase family protein [Pseudosulfitobacter sp. DSM 107133]|uniref:carboxymuconolactone decarboxylase family protein n=1 Tax=Pseudosulfitobacter sp. DSM 107133 TaxID=2883100 RepID=UPI000DF26584|nr:carboxymuconolactone decarboxylase family protein [Pseudosulfitobacter sp. DSM 107133]UOA26754.1 hypothetical protein DSM107133_01458 [Pseudosulfitobacter sp. DSM 107133]